MMGIRALADRVRIIKRQQVAKMSLGGRPEEMSFQCLGTHGQVDILLREAYQDSRTREGMAENLVVSKILVGSNVQQSTPVVY